MKKYINSRTIFLSTLICIVLLFYSLSYNFFLTNFIQIEKIQNEKNIHNLINHFNSNFDSLVSISNTFKQNGFNIPHIEDLNQLGLDFIIYQNSKKKNIFSQYSQTKENSSKILNHTEFETNLFEHFSSIPEVHTIFKFEQRLFYVVKTTVHKNLTLYVGKILNNQNLKQLSIDFEQLFIGHQKELKQETLKLSSKYIPIISIDVELSDK
ncbi:MAG: hypothetical protein CVU67_06095, partial [Deltaproteobacteria bacterium HGW-Deltaproteobacteria-24]